MQVIDFEFRGVPMHIVWKGHQTTLSGPHLELVRRLAPKTAEEMFRKLLKRHGCAFCATARDKRAHAESVVLQSMRGKSVGSL